MSNLGKASDAPLIECPRASEELKRQFPEYGSIITSLHKSGYAILDMDFKDDDLAEAARFCASLPASEARRQDGWLTNQAVQSLASHAPVLDLLSALYGRQAFPFQTLNFAFGSQQAAHSDTYHFNSKPYGFMSGVWVALEDVHPSAGPVFYYPGSHKLPILERCDIQGEQSYGDYERQIETRSKRAGQEPEEALLKRGQALIWVANLVHGGARRKNLALTRFSQVTHYFFEDCAYYTPKAFNLKRDMHYLREPYNIAAKRFVKSASGLLNGKPSPWARLQARRQVFNAQVRRAVLKPTRRRK